MNKVIDKNMISLRPANKDDFLDIILKWSTRPAKLVHYSCENGPL